MNFFAALTCTIFAWGLEEGSKVFLRNFQSAEVIFPQHTQNTDSLAAETYRTIRSITYFNNTLLAILKHLSKFATAKKLFAPNTN